MSGAALDPRARFSDRVSDYARSRPSYPAAAIDAILDGLGARQRLAIADVGAGTGISSRALAGDAEFKSGPRVIAIEPNNAMREAGEREAHPRIEWREGAGEATGLPDAGADVVVCAQAFHWLAPESALPEFHRILRPGGRAALVWNTRNRADPASEAYYDAVARHAVNPPQSPWARAGAGIGESSDEAGLARPLADSPRFKNYRLLRFANTQRLDEAGLIARAMSASYAPKSGPGHEALVRELRHAFARHAAGGRIALVYTTEVHLAERAS